MNNKFLRISSIILLALLGLYLLAYIAGYADNLLPFFILPVLVLLLSRIGRKVLLGILGLLLLVLLLLQTDYVQNIIIGAVTKRLSKDLNTEVSIKHVSISFFDKLDLDGTLIRDNKKDTLLYAGTMKVRVTDWFFLKNNIDLKYIGLENALIKMNRKDSVWNYQFIADHFASSDTTTSKDGKNITLNLQKIDLKKVRFVQQDDWIGQTMTVKIGSMLADISKTDLKHNTILVNTVDLDRPYFSIEDYDGYRPDSLRKKNTDTGMYFNTGDLLLKVASIKMTDGGFVSMKRGDVPDKGVFDGTNIRVSKINGNIENVSFIKDTIKAKISLSAFERSGFELSKLKADFRLTPQIMEFAKLDIRTPHSRLGDYYAMRYKDFNEDMSAYIEQVIMDARFRNSTVSSDDIAFFAPELSTWKQKAAISGKFLGTVDDFKVDNIFVRTDANTYATGDLTMKGLPDVGKTIITFNDATVQTNNREIAFLYPGITKITTPDMAALGNVLFRGNFKGTINNFSTTGTLSSMLGGMYADINMNLPAKGEPSYKGNIQTKQFDLGRFVRVSTLGKMSFKGKVEGRSFELDKVKTTLDGIFDSLQFNGYTYRNLTFSGAIAKEKIDGDFKADDPNFDFLSSIQIDLSDKQPSFNILGDLAKANFRSLNFTNKDFQLTGLFDLNFTGHNIDDFLGSAKILNATLLHDSTKLDFDSLSVNAYIDDANRKVLSAESNQFDVKVTGQYNILDLPNSFQSFLSRYYPAYINAPAKEPKDQRFFVQINTKDFDKYARVIDPRLSGLDYMQLSGGVNTINRDSGFYLRAEVPYAKFDKYKLENANIKGIGSADSLRLTGDVERIYIGDSLFFPNTYLNILSANDHSGVHISTSASETLNNADLNADVVTLEDGVRINFQPSSFVVNTKKWELNKEGELIIRKNFASAKNVKFSQGFQEITVETEEEEGTNASNLVVRLKNVNMGDFTSLVTTNPRLEGLANGVVYLRDFYTRFNAQTSLKVEQFRLDDDSVGVVNLNGAYSSESGKVSFKVKSDNEDYHFDIDGFYNVKDSTNEPLNTTMHMKGTRITFVNTFLAGIFSNIEGLATGDLTVKGDPRSPDLLGQATLRNAGLTVDYTQVRYTVDSAILTFNKGSIDFGRFSIKDKYNNKGSVRGILYENGFKNMRYDFDMATDKLLVLDTKFKDNQQFYGKAIAKATLSIKGPQENMKMNISGEPVDTTHISIVTSGSKESTDADFIVFKKYGTEIIAPEKQSDTKLNIALDLVANNKAQIDVILDQLTGDVISATGEGRMRINVPATGSMTMNGRYNIESGRYNFNFQSFLRKPFDLRRNAGNYIEWNGDPYKAQMKIDAQYTAKNVSFNELLSNTGINLGGAVSGYRGEVYVIAHLTGNLSNPDIRFSFDFPGGSPIENDNNLQLFLAKVENDDNEMIKQVTFLIVFGSFAPYGQLGNGGNIAQSTGINTISQQITNELNKLVSNLLTKITGDKSLQFDINTSTYSSSTLYGTSNTQNRLDRQVVNLKVNQSILNDKVIITLGTGLDFNLGSSAVQTGNFQFLPDISIEFILSTDRKLRAIVFNKSSLDVTTGIIGRRIRQGVSISYSFDFPQDKIPIPVTAVPSTDSSVIKPETNPEIIIKGSK
ncbi:hypothetical protein FRZ67_14825 [Panacibacter ginsenosidivorans]|uniref:Translocation and assembly module TamB C-terminal domain-containing protein n=1 Tax=Panacibacter ginsenosidivorans TaxID=1813871 RepID=A0A5B8VCY8_9BACT|nr:translocation/assembly module TamB domain-containing protein [Panacibacter ginsenosidivorans]QEC68516.1 hypothetical protein FRZ67_14825 [Panacibacter ginsenosidivorans]